MKTSFSHDDKGDFDVNESCAVADPGFPRGGGANSPGVGAPTYDFTKFCQKLHEIERIWTPGGARLSRPP